jgi:DNA-binding response OmpR family regulator
MNNYRPLIIFADDDEDLLKLVKMKLTSEGFDVKLCLNGEKIVSLAAVEKPDIILLDITMQGADGRDLCLLLKSTAATSFIPVILISGNDNLENIAALYGADDYVTKPFNTHVVKQKIDHLLAA